MNDSHLSAEMQLANQIAGERMLRIHDLEEELAGVQARLDQSLDLIEWLKHAMSEQAWHFRATVEALDLQYRHDVKRGVAKQRSTVVFGDVETEYSHGYADGQVT